MRCMSTAYALHVHVCCRWTPPRGCVHPAYTVHAACTLLHATYALRTHCMCTACAPHVQVDPSALLLHHAACWWAAEARADGAEHGAEHGGDAPRPPPLWLNDGPVPTAGLLRYKAQYHGALLQVYSRCMADTVCTLHARSVYAACTYTTRTHVHVDCGCMHIVKPYIACPLQVYSLQSAALLRAAARARWPTLLSAWRRARGRGLHLGEKKIWRAARRIYGTR